MNIIVVMPVMWCDKFKEWKRRNNPKPNDQLHI